jgi:uncharacterized protein (TIGR04255 family)
MIEGNEHIPKLPHAPLQEVIFELRWKLDFDRETQTHVDKEFQFAFANFTSLTAAKLKHKVILKPPILADTMFNNRPIYQYWAGINQYPVFQLGPGIFTVNETEKNYYWNYFRDLILEGVEWLSKSYTKAPDFSVVELRYIDAIEVDSESEQDLAKFISDNLRIEIHNKLVQDRLSDLQLHQRFKLENDNHLGLLITNGIKNNKQSKVIILQTSFNKTSNISLENLTTWIDLAHDTCSSLFRQMISTNLYEQFSKTN